MISSFGEPNVEVRQLDVPVTILEFETVVDGNPEARLFAKIAEYTGAGPRIVVEGMAFEYRRHADGTLVQVASLYTREPVEGVDG